ncbi:MAG: tRNA pseudouridine(38-40) synthase TruA [Pirellulales bacterium]|nr:tRNA pseudouridine(38-40) synthase TruA [Pirellulales bacterium]
MRKIRLVIAYDGTHFHGWQTQPGVRTVQGALNDAVTQITGTATEVVGSSRTDAGVHALGQLAHFETPSALDAATLQRAINARLSSEVRVREAAEASDDFHAIGSTVRKRYRYVLHDGPIAPVFRRQYAWHHHQRLDDAAMHEAARTLCGTHDFASFENQGPTRQSSVRTVLALDVTRQPPPWDDFIHVEVEADGFLYNMVRNLVGTLVEVGRRHREPAWPAQVLAARDRRAAGMTAPPQGLFLLWVDWGSGAPQSAPIES